MEKITYASLKLKNNLETKDFDFEGHSIKVSQYLPINEKYDLVMITLQKSLEDGIYNPIKKDLYFHLNLIYLYSNITFTEKQKEDESKLYDTLVSNGILEKILELIPESEYAVLYGYIEELEDKLMTYNTSFSGVVNNLIEELPKNAQKAADLISDFDKDKYQNVIDFVKSANNGNIID